MDFKCKCGSESFFIQSKGSQIGLYCSACGKWQKWLTKNEVKQFEYETNMLDSKENNPDDDFYKKFALTPWGCLWTEQQNISATTSISRILWV